MEHPSAHRFTELFGVKTHNLKNIDVRFPQGRFSVVTGVSGSGKSSLVFDSLYAEGHRRYVESLSTYTRQFLDKIPRPEIESVKNILPALALEQNNQVVNNRTLVINLGDLYDLLQLLFAHTATLSCPQCSQPLLRFTPSEVARQLFNFPEGTRYYITSPAQEHQTTSMIAQGISRILVFQGHADPQLIDLSEMNEPAISELFKNLKPSDQAHWVIDRFAQKETLSGEDMDRLIKSIEHAMFISEGKLTVYTLPDWTPLHFHQDYRCLACQKPVTPPSPDLFSFQSAAGACSHCSGFGFTLDLSESRIIPNPQKTLADGAIDPFTKPAYKVLQKLLLKFCEDENIPTDKPYSKLTEGQKQKIWKGPELRKKAMSWTKYSGIYALFEELKEYRYKMHIRVFIRRYQEQTLCSTCRGSRLNQNVRIYLLGSKSLIDVLPLNIHEARQWYQSLQWNPFEQVHYQDLLQQIHQRFETLEEVGLGYLHLNRLARTLSGGECQRLALANQLSQRLSSTLYVLDEPSIGLHPVDTNKIIGLLKRLRDLGNTVVVVEHDQDVINSSDYLVELGPKAGESGGTIIYQGNTQTRSQEEVMEDSLKIRPAKTRPALSSSFLELTGARGHNLKGISVKIPLQQMTCVTGVSGSGKTTLIHGTLYKALKGICTPAKASTSSIVEENDQPEPFDRLYGSEMIQSVYLLDQSPIGKSSRSNPATYLKIYDEIRDIFGNLPDAQKRGLSARSFSFNVDDGRCPTCKGEGEVFIDLHFMSELRLPCEVCDGRRFKKTVLSVQFQGKNILDVLDTTVDDAWLLFRDHLKIQKKLKCLQKVGLGYLRLGQSSSTLSGGESQRLKVASVLDSGRENSCLYIFDEPTRGLHSKDISVLLQSFQELLESGHTVVVIEHNLQVMTQADWIIDLGPGAGPSGGQLVAQGTVADIIKEKRSLTGTFLADAEKAWR